MVSEAEKKRIDTWLDKHLKELIQPRGWSQLQDVLGHTVPKFHYTHGFNIWISKHMINFPMMMVFRGLLIVLHGVQDRNEGQDLIGLCKTPYFTERDQKTY